MATRTERERTGLTAIRNVTGAVARTGLSLASLTIVGALLLKRAVGSRPGAWRPDRVPDRTRTVPLLLALVRVQTLATTGVMQIEPYLAAYGIADRFAAGLFMGGRVPKAVATVLVERLSYFSVPVRGHDRAFPNPWSISGNTLFELCRADQSVMCTGYVVGAVDGLAI